MDDFCNFITLTKDLRERNFNEQEIKKFCIDVFLYKLGKLGKNIYKQSSQKIYSIATEHIKFLKEMSSSLNFIYKFKINFSVFLLKSFNIYSFKIFRVLKNFFKIKSVFSFSTFLGFSDNSYILHIFFKPKSKFHTGYIFIHWRNKLV